MKSYIFFIFYLIPLIVTAQNGSIKGVLFNDNNAERIPFALILVQGTDINTTSNLDGEFELTNVKPGIVNIEISSIGFNPKTVYEIEVTTSRPAFVNVALTELSINLKQAEVVTNSAKNSEESPLSVRSIGANEIKRNPGGGRDISRALRSLPGVVSIPTFRNDLVIRGGAPNENRFFIDGIEIPTINHFSTQGSSGGAVGMINVDLVENVELNTGAFPANRMNALSSVLDFEFKSPRTDIWTTNAVVGTSDLGITIEGPTGENSSLVMSARRSYLQALFKVLGLPFLPIYNDLQYKWVWNINNKNKLTVLGIGAIDNFELNTDIASDPTAENFLSQVAILDYLDIQKQWNYTQGVKLDHFGENGVWSFIASRNMLNNRAFKHENNDTNLQLTKDYESQESENKFRIERKVYQGAFKTLYGANFDLCNYSNSTFERQYNFTNDSLVQINYSTDLNLNKYGVYAQSSGKFLDNKLIVSFGIRADGASLEGWRINSISPRASLSWSFSPGWSFNANTGLYNQLPSYTILGFNNSSNPGELTNLNSNTDFTKCYQVVTGIKKDFDKTNTSVSLEGFYKTYTNSPISVSKGIPLANLGADFGVIGNEQVVFDGLGKAYGSELFIQQKLYKGVYGLISYTWFRSFYSIDSETWSSSSWDSKHILSITGGKKFESGLEIGARFFISGGLPYTPYLASSFNTEIWDTFNRPILDYSLLNSERNKPFHQLDIRVDQRLFFSKWTMDIFLEIQNVYGSEIPSQQTIDVVRDPNTGEPIDANQDGIYETQEFSISQSVIIPAIGIIIEL